MAVISKIADGQAAAASIDLSGVGINAGDIVVIHAYRNGSTTVPSSPGANWTDIATSAGANTNSRRIGYRVIQSGDNLATISGTWTNATAIQFIALRGQHLTTPIGGNASGGTNTTTLTTPTVSMTVTDGTSWVIAFAGSKSTNANTVTLSSTTDEGSSQGALNLATGRGVTSYTSRNYSATVNASGNRMDAVEIEAAPPISTSLNANAVILKNQSASFTADAVTKATLSTSFSADAVLKATESASFTADAYVFSSLVVNITADAVLLRSQSGTLAVDAIALRAQSATFSTDAVVRATVSSSYSADAVQLKTTTAGLSADAVILKGRLDGYTADADFLSLQTASITADAVISLAFITFTADAFIHAERLASLGIDAVIFGTEASSFTADAVIAPKVLTADAWIIRPNYDFIVVTLTAATISAELTTEVTVIPRTFTADAIVG